MIALEYNQKAALTMSRSLKSAPPVDSTTDDQREREKVQQKKNQQTLTVLRRKLYKCLSRDHISEIALKNSSQLAISIWSQDRRKYERNMPDGFKYLI